MLPGRANVPAANGDAPACSERGVTATDLAGIRVLVVDDEADARELLCFVFEIAGAEVHIAASAGEALTLLARVKPHVLVSDIGMPAKDGYMLMREIRQLSPEENGQVPAIAVTAFSSAEDRMTALSAGFDEHVGKPASPAALVTAVKKLGPHRGSIM